MISKRNSLKKTFIKSNFCRENNILPKNFRSTFLTKTKSVRKPLKRRSLLIHNNGTLNFELLNVFYTLVLCGSVNQTSKRLYISQPSISLCIGKLEREVGFTLFHRQSAKKILRLTPSALVLFNHVMRLFQIMRESFSLSNTMLLGLYEDPSKLKLFSKLDQLNSSDLNLRFNYQRRKFLSYNIISSSSVIFSKLNFRRNRIFETRSSLLIINSKYYHLKELNLIALIPKIEATKSIKLERPNIADLSNSIFMLQSSDHSTIEVQTLKSFELCLELEIYNLIYWGSEF